MTSPFASQLSPFPACYHFVNPNRIARRELSTSCRRQIKRKETYLDRTCGKTWVARNRLGEDFIFARFNRGRADHVIVTLAAYLPRVGWVTQH